MRADFSKRTKPSVLGGGHGCRSLWRKRGLGSERSSCFANRALRCGAQGAFFLARLSPNHKHVATANRGAAKYKNP